MTQKECFKLFDKHYDQIKHEYLNHKNPALLTQHDFSDGAKTYVEGNWYAVGISSGDRKVNNIEQYPILYSILEGPGRFIVNTKLLRNMKDVVEAIYPDREKICVPRRRGDRKTEIFLSTSEIETEERLFGEVLKVTSNHDKDFKEN